VEDAKPGANRSLVIAERIPSDTDSRIEIEAIWIDRENVTNRRKRR
jgi:hypothetical protein